MAGETGMARRRHRVLERRQFYLYNVDAAVGKGCPNNPLDVLLVQYLLKECDKLPSFAKVEADAGSHSGGRCRSREAWDQYWDGYLANFELTLARSGVAASRGSSYRSGQSVGGFY